MLPEDGDVEKCAMLYNKQVLYTAVYKNRALFKTVNLEDIMPTV
jgi:hypothetical protein